MLSDPDQILKVTSDAVLLCWSAFAAVFIFRKRPPKVTETRRDPTAWLGIFLQGCGYWTVWFGIVRSSPRKTARFSAPTELALGIFTVAVAVASVWLVMAAVRTLGKQWAVAARLVEGHRLITSGPYAFVRNPIYTGMLGMLVATGLVAGDWMRLVVGIVLFAIGMMIRVRSEEKLLRSAFGQEFEDYTRRVPAVLPGIF